MRHDGFQLLEIKSEEMQKDLEGWAATKNLLSLGEVIKLRLEIEKSPIVRVEIRAPNRDYVLAEYRALTPAEWGEIEALPFKPHDIALLKIMRAGNGQLDSKTLRDKIGPEHRGRPLFGNHQHNGETKWYMETNYAKNRINRVFKSHGKQFMIRSSEDRYLRLCVIPGK